MARGKARGKARHSPGRRSNDEEEDGSGRWLTTYGDAVTLLLAFFVLLFSMSTIDAQKFAAMAQAMAVALGAGAGDGLLDASTGIVGEETQPHPETPPEAPAAPAEPIVAPPAVDLAAELEEALTEAGLQDLATVTVERDDVVVRIGTDNVLFEVGSARIDPRGARVIHALAPIVVDAPNDVRIEGHTDDLPLNTAGYTNWNLSTDRAVAVLALLYDRHGVAPQRLSAAGYGQYRPLRPNDSPADRAVNRRVEIVLAGNQLPGNQLPGNQEIRP